MLSIYRVVVELLYVERPFYSFKTEATDIGNNVGHVQTIVELNDIPNLPPTFTRAFGVQRYDEKREEVSLKHDKVFVQYSHQKFVDFYRNSYGWGYRN